MKFQDRADAAKKLAFQLAHYKNKNALVLAIPRGGVPMAKIIADAIAGDLDVVLVHKLSHPQNPEYAIGAIDEDGALYLEGKTEPEDANKQLERLRMLREQYTSIRKRHDPRGRTVIIVDDGIATGWTVRAAIAMLKRGNAKRIVVATPVGPGDTIEQLEKMVDEVVCLQRPSHFQAVGEFYKDFSQVTDEEVARILKNT